MREELIRIRVPASVYYTGILRLAVYHIANRMNFDIGLVEDMRIAVDEASYVAIILAHADSLIEMTVSTPDSKTINIGFSAEADKTKEIESALNPLNKKILETIVDSFSIYRENDEIAIKLTKKKMLNKNGISNAAKKSKE